MKRFIAVFVVLFMYLLILRNSTTASPLDAYYEEDSLGKYEI